MLRYCVNRMGRITLPITKAAVEQEFRSKFPELPETFTISGFLPDFSDYIEWDGVWEVPRPMKFQAEITGKLTCMWYMSS